MHTFATESRLESRLGASGVGVRLGCSDWKHAMVSPGRHVGALLVIASLAVVSFACVAQTGKPQQVDVTISCEELQRQHRQARSVTVAGGGVVEVTLCSNASTGYQWEPVVIIDQAALSLSDHQYVAPQSGTPVVGAAGVERWRFDAIASDTRTTTVDFHYSQPWSGGTKNAWSLTLTVRVGA